MRDIPKHIRDRCTFQSIAKGDPIEKIKSIKPVDPCPCGRELEDVRRVRLAKTVEPIPHWREYCNTCKLVSIAGENNWYPAKDLNCIMRKADFTPKNHTKITKRLNTQ